MRPANRSSGASEGFRAQADARDKYHEEMAKLRAQFKLAAGKLDEMRLAGEENWEKMNTEMEKVRDAFTHSFRYFKSQI
jgi:hypothetical protein